MRVELGCHEGPGWTELPCSPYLPRPSGRGLGAEAEGEAGRERR